MSAAELVAPVVANGTRITAATTAAMRLAVQRAAPGEPCMSLDRTGDSRRHGTPAVALTRGGDGPGRRHAPRSAVVGMSADAQFLAVGVEEHDPAMLKICATAAVS